MGLWQRIRAWFGGDDAARRRARRKRRSEGTDENEFVRLAERYLRMRMEDTALHIRRRGLEVTPGHVEGRVLLARIQLAKGLDSEAAATLAALEESEPGRPDVAELRSALRSGEERVAAAPPAPKRTVKTGEISTDTLAEHYVRQGQVDRAIEIYRQMLATKPHNELIRTKLAELEEMERRKSEGRARQEAELEALERFRDHLRRAAG